MYKSPLNLKKKEVKKKKEKRWIQQAQA